MSKIEKNLTEAGTLKHVYNISGRYPTPEHRMHMPDGGHLVLHDTWGQQINLSFLGRKTCQKLYRAWCAPTSYGGEDIFEFAEGYYLAERILLRELEVRNSYIRKCMWEKLKENS